MGNYKKCCINCEYCSSGVETCMAASISQGGPKIIPQELLYTYFCASFCVKSSVLNVSDKKILNEDVDHSTSGNPIKNDVVTISSTTN